METGVGSIYTTAEDLSLWNKTLDSPWFLSANALAFMFTAHPPGNYGYGWFVETSPRWKVYHEGEDPGLAAFEACYLISTLSLSFWRTRTILRSGKIGDEMAKHLLGDCKRTPVKLLEENGAPKDALLSSRSG
jgi:hypothetical protein